MLFDNTNQPGKYAVDRLVYAEQVFERVRRTSSSKFDQLCYYPTGDAG